VALANGLNGRPERLGRYDDDGRMVRLARRHRLIARRKKTIMSQ
jgi:hypothetical protein